MKTQIEFFYKNAVDSVANSSLFVEKNKHNVASTIVGNFRIDGGNFLRFTQKFIEQGTFNPNSHLTYNDDGVVLEVNSNTLLVVEIKTTIGFQTYQKILKQLCASYIKTLHKLSLVQSPEKIDLQLFIIGNWHLKDNEEQAMALDTAELNEHQLIYKSYWRLRKKGFFIFPTFPHLPYLTKHLAQEYRKTNVKIHFFPPDSTHNHGAE